MKRIASIDIGTQTIRLLVAECSTDGRLIPVYRDNLIVRLGEGMNENKQLKCESIERAVTCIALFIHHAQTHGAKDIFAVATACVRNANNAGEFLKQVFSAAGIMPKVVSGDEEALLSLKGVQSALRTKDGQLLIIDIGGGSTEFISIDNNNITALESIPLGVIGLSEKHLNHDPPLPDEIASLHEEILHILKSQCSIINTIKISPGLAGTAGTVTNLAAMDLNMTSYVPDKINRHQLTQKRIDELFKKMIALPLSQRSILPGLEPGRSLVIIPGAAIVLNIMKRLKTTTMLVSDAGLLEGVILEKFGI